MKNYLVALFGEAEKGSFQTLTYIQTISQLMDIFGNPPEDTLGIPLAIQTLLYKRELIYFRVQEEGFSSKDYLSGIKQLENCAQAQHLCAICMPGVGDHTIIDASFKLCEKRGSIFITSPQDLFDLLLTYGESA